MPATRFSAKLNKFRACFKYLFLTSRGAKRRNGEGRLKKERWAMGDGEKGKGLPTSVF
jgi:hypothetical protein